MALASFALLLLVLGGSVEEIPDELPPVDPAVEIAALTLPQQRDLPKLRLGDLRGRQVVMFLADQGAVMSMEGSRLRNALARWSLPDDVVCFEVAGMMDIPGFLRGSMEGMMGSMAAEWRFPMYLDYGSAFRSAFQIPKGHVGLVILDRSGEVVLRRAGDSTQPERDLVRSLLGASLPPPFRAAPDLTDLDPALEGPLVLIFLDREVSAGEIASAGMMAMAKALPDPSLRLLVQFAHGFDLPRATRVGVVGGFVGAAPWITTHHADDGALRERLSIPPDSAAIVAVDAEGRLVGREHGTVPLWKISGIAESVGATPRLPGRGRGG